MVKDRCSCLPPGLDGWKVCNTGHNELVGNYVVIYARKTSWGLGRGHCPSPENFSILSLKMVTFSALWALAHVARGGHGPSRPPWIRQC